MNGMDVRKGPWTPEEDSLLLDYVSVHGEGHCWDTVARSSGLSYTASAGLKRTGKSCRLRWLNHLRPGVRRGNITLEERLTILELHSRFGNCWSKIAQHLPGRTDNQIKNFWRTRVQKHAKHLNCDVNSHHFRHALRYVWMPRLAERIRPPSLDPVPPLSSDQYCPIPVPPKPSPCSSSHSLSHDDPIIFGTDLQNGSGLCPEKLDWWGGEEPLEESVWTEENISFLRQLLDD